MVDAQVGDRELQPTTDRNEGTRVTVMEIFRLILVVEGPPVQRRAKKT